MKRIYGIIGNPLAQSMSGRYFNAKFANEGIDAEHLNFELQDIGDLMELIAEEPHLSGLNVTIPYKQLVIPYLTALDAEASEVGAVNVISFERDDSGNLRLIGHNTDAVGFRRSITPLLTPERNKALILGTGGASKAVAATFRTLGVDYTFVSRTPEAGMLGYPDLTPEVMDEYKVIVNTTPLGMFPDVESAPDIPYSLLTPQHLCFDLVYNPEMTSFLLKSKAAGAEVKNGKEMFLLQAEATWHVWNESN
ncbi:MAG: shikimate dehydrogenase [Duncaniella sp.]|nr:shikimate dehydrogenase [Duncaniella sp.]